MTDILKLEFRVLLIKFDAAKLLILADYCNFLGYSA